MPGRRGQAKGEKHSANTSAPIRARKIEWLQTLCGSSRGRARMRNGFRIPKRTTAFLAVVVASVLGLYGIPARGQMAGVTLYISGDTNIQEMFDKDLLPLFERETSVKTKMVFLEHGQGAESILTKIIAAKRTGQQTDVDLYETQPTFIAQGWSEGFSGLTYDQARESAWEPALQLLRSLKSNIYNNGFYPNGNVAVLQLLGRENIYMAPVWSDQGMSYLDQGLLPKDIKLVQVSPPFTGGDSAIAIPVHAEHQASGLMFLNWLLTSKAQTIVVNKLAGYPGIDWKYMPKDVRDKFAGIAQNFSPLPNAKYQADAKRLWQEKVAGSGQ